MKNNNNNDDLKNLSKQQIIELIISQNKTIEDLSEKYELLLKQLMIMNQVEFGKPTEEDQPFINLAWFDLALNEAEVTQDDTVEEPTEEDLPKKKKRVTKEDKFKKITNHREEIIELSEEKLNQKHGEGKWKRVIYEGISKLEHHPAAFELITYKIGVYAKNDNQTIVRANRPLELIPGSVVTPSLLSSIVFAKYVNAVPLYRQEEIYGSSDVHIKRQTMANWIIKTGEKYLEPFYEKMKKDINQANLIYSYRTIFKITRKGRSTGSKSYLWVYRTAKGDTPCVIYDYQKPRKTSHPIEFLKDFKGILFCNGFEADHKPEQFLVSGCWAQIKQNLAVVMKSMESNPKRSLADIANNKILNFYHIESLGKELSNEERYKYRQEKVKPLVDEFFEWIRENENSVLSESEIGKAFTYALNQEKYLRTFLDHPNVPLDDEITPAITRRNWVFVAGSDARISTILYSIVESAKANNLKLYDYLNYIYTELPKYVQDLSSNIRNSIMPCSKELPDTLRN